MRNVYILLTLTIILIISLLVFAFLFLEREKHQTSFYSVENACGKTASLRIDCYKTEDKIIYKSTCFYLDAPRKIVHEKLVFDRNTFRLERFFRECKNFARTGAVSYIDIREKGSFNFLSRDRSKSSFAVIASGAKDTVVFHEESIVTYMPLINEYDFVKGGAQSFDCVYRSPGLFPPARARVTLTSIRDEYIKIMGRKIKTEFLIMKSKTLPECGIWVSKKNRDIVQLKIESKSLLIKKVRDFEKILPEKPRAENRPYETKEIIFQSGGFSLAGTLEIPRKEGKLACVLLIGEESSCGKRDTSRFFTDLSSRLAENENIVMRFDERGTGKSQGNNAEVALGDTITDIENALKFLANHERVNRDKVFIVAHGSVCSYLSRLNLSEITLRGILMLGIARAVPIMDFECAYVLDEIRTFEKIDKGYNEILNASRNETLKSVKNTKKESEIILGRRVFLKRMRELLRLDALAGFRNIRTPLVIMYGKKDKFCPLSYIRDIEKNLNQAGSRDFSTVSFRGLGHFFEKTENGDNAAKTFKIDAEALKEITLWIKKRCTLPDANS